MINRTYVNTILIIGLVVFIIMTFDPWKTFDRGFEKPPLVTYQARDQPIISRMCFPLECQVIIAGIMGDSTIIIKREAMTDAKGLRVVEPLLDKERNSLICFKYFPFGLPFKP